PGGQGRDAANVAAVELEQPARAQAAEVQPLLQGNDAVQVQLVRRRRPAFARRIERQAAVPVAVPGNVQPPGEAVAVEIEAEQGIETGRREVQPAPEAADLVAGPEVRRAPGAELPELPVPGEQLVAGRDEDAVTVERDPPQAAVPAAPLPVDVDRVPVDRLHHALAFQVDEVDASVTLALPGAAYDGGCNQCGQESSPVPGLAVRILPLPGRPLKRKEN